MIRFLTTTDVNNRAYSSRTPSFCGIHVAQYQSYIWQHTNLPPVASVNFISSFIVCFVQKLTSTKMFVISNLKKIEKTYFSLSWHLMRIIFEGRRVVYRGLVDNSCLFMTSISEMSVI